MVGHLQDMEINSRDNRIDRGSTEGNHGNNMTSESEHHDPGPALHHHQDEQRQPYHHHNYHFNITNHQHLFDHQYDRQQTLTSSSMGNYGYVYHTISEDEIRVAITPRSGSEMMPSNPTHATITIESTDGAHDANKTVKRFRCNFDNCLRTYSVSVSLSLNPPHHHHHLLMAHHVINPF